MAEGGQNRWSDGQILEDVEVHKRVPCTVTTRPACHLLETIHWLHKDVPRVYCHHMPSVSLATYSFRQLLERVEPII